MNPSPKALKPWPVEPERIDGVLGISANGLSFPEGQKLLVLMYYQRARADKWEEVARMAVAGLRDALAMSIEPSIDEVINESLNLIGDLPEGGG